MGEGAASFRLKLVARSIAALAIVAALLFVSAGRVDLPWFWVYLGLLGAFAIGTLSTVSRELIEERVRPAARGRDSLALLRALGFAAFLGQWVVAGLDAGRFHWSAPPPPPVRAAALLGWAAVFAVWHLSMRANPFFSVEVRIQRDRGHHVVSGGPYGFVRHPGYAAFVLLGWCGALVLGSSWAAAFHAPVVVLFVRRAALEDRMLLQELEGYAEYASRVRYRLLPGVW